MEWIAIAGLIIELMKQLDSQNKKKVTAATVKNAAKVIGKEKEIKKIEPLLPNIVWMINNLFKSGKKK